MVSNNSITDFEPIRSNQNRQITADQLRTWMDTFLEQAEGPKQAPHRSGMFQLTNALNMAGIRNASALNTNASHRQTTSQQLYLGLEIGSKLFWAAVVAVVWLALGVTALALHDLKASLIITGFFLVVLLFLGSCVRNELSDFLSGKVQVKEGWVSRFSHTDRGERASTNHYYYRLNQVVLEVSKPAYDALVEGSYRVFYLPNTKKVVNIDPLQDQG